MPVEKLCEDLSNDENQVCDGNEARSFIRNFASGIAQWDFGKVSFMRVEPEKLSVIDYFGKE